ncbi:MAG TPA: hypothetical protein PKG98_11830 [Myxococcota bacterium]|nr:hypothetical protein [Myxococcota bacterium]
MFVCACGDGDGVIDCRDQCPGLPDFDTDGDGTANCLDACDNDPLKTAPGFCGCGTADTDTDDDGTPDCNDACPLNKYLATDLGDCGDCDWIWWTCPPEGQNCYEFCHGDPINHPDPCEPCL